MGRSGTMWAIEQEGVVPDIVTAGKGIASGLPLGAMIAREDLMVWELGAHGSTYGGSPVSCAAALATFDVIEDEGLIANARAVGDVLLDGLREIAGAPSADPRGPRPGAVDRARRSPTTTRPRRSSTPAFRRGPADAHVRRRRDPDQPAARVPRGPGAGRPRDLRGGRRRGRSGGRRWGSTPDTLDVRLRVTRRRSPPSGPRRSGSRLDHDPDDRGRRRVPRAIRRAGRRGMFFQRCPSRRR